MNQLLLNLLLAIAWTILTGKFTPTNFVSGFVVGYAVLWLTQRSRIRSQYFMKMPQLVGFLLFFIKEFVLANLRVTYDILTPRHHMRPAVIAVPLDAKTETEITFLANLITLTPGTLSLDVSTDRRVLYVHNMYVRDVDEARRRIKEGFERRLLQLLR